MIKTNTCLVFKIDITNFKGGLSKRRKLEQYYRHLMEDDENGNPLCHTNISESFKMGFPDKLWLTLTVFDYSEKHLRGIEK